MEVAAVVAPASILSERRGGWQLDEPRPGGSQPWRRCASVREPVRAPGTPAGRCPRTLHAWPAEQYMSRVAQGQHSFDVERPAPALAGADGGGAGTTKIASLRCPPPPAKQIRDRRVRRVSALLQNVRPASLAIELLIPPLLVSGRSAATSPDQAHLQRHQTAARRQD